MKLAAALKEAGLVASNSEANRKIAEGAVRVDGNKTTDRETRLAAGRRIHPAAGPAEIRPRAGFTPLNREQKRPDPVLPSVAADQVAGRSCGRP